MKLNIILIILTLYIFSNKTLAQKEVCSNKILDHFYLGSNFGISINSTYSYIHISPRIGYMFNNNFSIGTGLTYIFLRNKYFATNQNVLGGNIFARHNILKNFYAQTEFELVNVKLYTVIPNTIEYSTRRNWVPALFLGAGVYESVANRLGISIGGYYNILYNSKKSPYNSAFIFRAGFSF